MKMGIRLLFLVALFMGCNDQTNEQAVAQKNIEIEMQMGVPYTLNHGDKIERHAEPTRLSVEKNSNSETSEVILLEGKASIIRN